MSRPYVYNYDRYEHDVRPQYPVHIPPAQPLHRPHKSWPPLPKAEDERVSLSREYKPQWTDTSSEEARFPGPVDQLPIIEDVNPRPKRNNSYSPEESDSDSDSIKTGSSSESSGPRTPPDSSGRNEDQRYVFIPKEGIEIPLTYDEPREPRYRKAKPTQTRSDSSRGRNERPRLDTKLENKHLDALPPRERAPSPYTYVPQPKAKEAHAFGDHLLSPDVLSPQVEIPHVTKRESSGRPSVRESSRRPQPFEEKAEKFDDKPRRTSHSARPPAPHDRFSTAQSGRPAAVLRSGSRSSYHHLSSDESDDNRRRSSKIRDLRNNGPLPPEMSQKSYMAAVDDLYKTPDRKSSSGLGPGPTPPRGRSAIPPPLSALPAGLVAASTLLPSPPLSSRRASPRASPAGSPINSPPHSPFASPSTTPPSERHQNDRASKTRDLGLTPRRPSQAPPSPRSSSFFQTESDHDRPSRQYAPKSRRTTPLPSQAPGRPQIDVRAPSPANHQKSFSHGTDESMYAKSRHLSLAPFDIPSPSTLKPPGQGQRRRASSSADVRPQLTVNPASVTPFTGFDSPIRSPSGTPRPTLPGRAVSVGAVPLSLPPCPRANPVTGYDDWYTLAGGSSSFSVCPSCRNVMLSAGHEHHLKPKSRHTAEQQLRCDMSLPWVRSAYTSIIKNRHSNLDVLFVLAEILADKPPCPGKVEDHRDWYRLKDPDNDRSVHDFQICPCCVQQLEAVLPSLRGVFHRSRSHHSTARVCSLRIDSKRFTTYVELLGDIAKQADDYRRPPNMYRFIELAKKLAEFPECGRDDMLLGQEWYYIPDLREFTVCEECFEEVVFPAIKQRQANCERFQTAGQSCCSLARGCQLPALFAEDEEDLS